MLPFIWMRDIQEMCIYSVEIYEHYNCDDFNDLHESLHWIPESRFINEAEAIAVIYRNFKE